MLLRILAGVRYLETGEQRLSRTGFRDTDPARRT